MVPFSALDEGLQGLPLLVALAHYLGVQAQR